MSHQEINTFIMSMTLMKIINNYSRVLISYVKLNDYQDEFSQEICCVNTGKELNP